MFPVHFRHATTEFREGGPHFARKAGTDGFLPFRVALAHARVHQQQGFGKGCRWRSLFALPRLSLRPA